MKCQFYFFFIIDEVSLTHFMIRGHWELRLYFLPNRTRVYINAMNLIKTTIAPSILSHPSMTLSQWRCRRGPRRWVTLIIPTLSPYRQIKIKKKAKGKRMIWMDKWAGREELSWPLRVCSLVLSVQPFGLLSSIN